MWGSSRTIFLNLAVDGLLGAENNIGARGRDRHKTIREIGLIALTDVHLGSGAQCDLFDRGATAANNGTDNMVGGQETKRNLQ